MPAQVWDDVPAPLRARLADIAAAAVGALPPVELPPTLRPLARFTPRKRARVGAGQLVGELATSAAFRAAVLVWWLEHREEQPDPVAVAAESLLADRPDAAELVAAIGERTEATTLRAERDTAWARVDKLTAELERLRAELAEARVAERGADAERDREITRLRAKVREQGSQVRRAEDSAQEARRELAELRRDTDQRLAAAEAARDRERARATAERTRAIRASEAVSDVQEVVSATRRADQVRLELLVETMSGALDGLRRELSLGAGGLGAGGSRPADLVAGASGRGKGGPPVVDTAGLDRLLALPGTHLIVDGYNVSKAGYPDLTLFDQRTRLIGGLGAITARTGAEVTCVFDGAAVQVGPERRPRGVRVLFSDAGVTADEVIRSLVAAEPSGRPLVVVSSDREVADGVRRKGAYPVPSAVLLDRLSRV
jgi:predicted RNA-binding protein with PIN domain